MTGKRYLDQRLRLQHLRAVYAMDRQGSLLKAAAALGITQPALTKCLHEVEDLLQIRLFNRHPRGVYPTEAGAAFVRSARRILAELHRLDDELDQLSHFGAATLALGALPVAAAGMLPGVLTRLKATHPGIKIRLRQGRMEELQPDLVAGEIDLIVGRLYEPAVPDSLAREALWSEPISVLARTAHPIFSEAVTIDALRRYDLALPTITQRVGQEIEHLLARLGIDPAAALRSGSYSLIREMLHGTDMLSVMPRLMMVGDLLRGTLQVVPLPIQAPDRPAGLIVLRDRALSPAGRAFAACLRAYVAEVAARGLAEPITGGDSADGNDDTTKGGGTA